MRRGWGKHTLPAPTGNRNRNRANIEGGGDISWHCLKTTVLMKCERRWGKMARGRLFWDLRIVVVVVGVVASGEQQQRE